VKLPQTCRALVFDPATRDLALRELPMRALRRREVLVRVSLSAICGSDLHTIRGRRDPGGPIVLGHEICGTVAALGEGGCTDALGHALAVGDRVTWGIAASCGQCFYCARGLPQKCLALFKYGHQRLDGDTPLSGGFAEYCYLVPGTPILRLPDDLPDATAVFANCSLATMCAAVRMAGVQPGDAVLIQGAGLVGMCAAALCADRRAGPIVVVDPCAERRELAGDFGATHTAAPEGGDLAAGLRMLTSQGRGFDVAIEACGVPAVIATGIEALRIGGAYITAGCVFPGGQAEIDMQALTTKLLRLQGLHNYAPLDLQEALRLLDGARDRFGFGRVVRHVFALGEIEAALVAIEREPGALRMALRP